MGLNATSASKARPSSNSRKKVYTFFCWGGFAPPDPPFKSAAVAASASQVRTLKPSRPLSRPPGWEVLGLGPDQGLARRPWDQARDWPGGPGLVLEVQVGPTMSVRAQNIKNDPNRIQNRPFGLKIGPEACQDRSGAFQTGPAAQKKEKS